MHIPEIHKILFQQDFIQKVILLMIKFRINCMVYLMKKINKDKVSIESMVIAKFNEIEPAGYTKILLPKPKSHSFYKQFK